MPPKAIYIMQPTQGLCTTKMLSYVLKKRKILNPDTKNIMIPKVMIQIGHKQKETSIDQFQRPLSFSPEAPPRRLEKWRPRLLREIGQTRRATEDVPSERIGMVYDEVFRQPRAPMVFSTSGFTLPQRCQNGAVLCLDTSSVRPHPSRGALQGLQGADGSFGEIDQQGSSYLGSSGPNIGFIGFINHLDQTWRVAPSGRAAMVGFGSEGRKAGWLGGGDGA